MIILHKYIYLDVLLGRFCAG